MREKKIQKIMKETFKNESIYASNYTNRINMEKELRKSRISLYKRDIKIKIRNLKFYIKENFTTIVAICFAIIIILFVILCVKLIA